MTNRRTFLKTGVAAAGAMHLSPLMSSVKAAVEREASGGKPPLRFVFCIKANGLWAEMIQPPGMLDRLPFKVEYDEKGRLVNSNNGNIRKNDTAAADLEMGAEVKLNPLMEPLAPFADRVSILQGINSGFNVYHLGQYQTLGAFQAKSRNSRETKTQTIDSRLAHAFAGAIPHIRLGHDPQAPSGVSYVPTSAAGPGKPLPFYTKPTRAYKELFGVVGDGAAKASYDIQSEILDFFVEDSKRLQSQFSGPEKDQLNLYLDAFSSIKRSRKEIEAMDEQLRKFAPAPPQEIEANSTMKIGEGNTEIAIAALLSGLTNVITLQFDQLGSSQYEGIGGLHGGVGHGQVKNIVEARRKICSFHFNQIARIAQALQSIPEGDGTMLDNTVIVYTSDNGETHHSSGVNYPMVILGDLGGRLKRRRYFAPGNGKVERSKPGYTRLGDVWATLLEAAGQKYEDFGIPINGQSHNPIPSLLSSKAS